MKDEKTYSQAGTLKDSGEEFTFQNAWRPVLMFAITAILFINYGLMPLLRIFTDRAETLNLPGDFFTVLMIGIGTAVAGRSGEKVAKTIKGLKND